MLATGIPAVCSRTGGNETRTVQQKLVNWKISLWLDLEDQYFMDEKVVDIPDRKS